MDDTKKALSVAGDKMKQMMGNIINSENKYYIHLALVVLIIIFVSITTLYVINQFTKKNSDLKYMKKDLEAIDKTIVNINDNDALFKHNIRDYYIMSSHNSCCDGSYENSYVSLDALKSVIFKGARVLDFEVYSVDNKAVISASDKDSFYEKGTYNSLNFGSTMNAIERFAFSAATSPNYDDPLFLHFRIKSNRSVIFDEMANSISSAFSSRLLSPKYGKENNGENLGAEPLLNFRGKVIIMCDKSVNTGFEKTKLDDLVNIASGGAFVRSIRDYDVKYTPNAQELIDYNKKNMILSMNDLSTRSDNMDAGIHHKYGCQMVCMNFQNVDSYMVYYLELFNNSNSAFILRPEELRFKPLLINAPKKQDPKLSYAQRKIQKPYFSHVL